MEIGTFEATSASQQKFPRVKIDHDSGNFVYVGSDSAARPESLGHQLTVVGLGLLRSRTLWNEKDRGGVLCSSPDSIHGTPRHMSGRNPGQIPLADGTVACATCPFESDCSRTWTVPAVILTAKGGTVPTGTEDPVVRLQFTGSSIKNLEPYLKPLRASLTPLYTTLTKITVRRGGRYSVAKFEKGASTAEARHPEYSRLLREVREFVAPRHAAPKANFQGIQMN